ncbi:hypothetical protein [Aeromonas phage Akh-2]|nr:hypothetical protein [Aeromonas phage Akh-2]
MLRTILSNSKRNLKYGILLPQEAYAYPAI